MPYDYPPADRPRRHAPQGYAQYRDFRPWLRDEFEFRCAYCLHRETWMEGAHINSAFPIDHIMPQSVAPDLVAEYDNLAYCCARCNFLKSDDIFLPSPLDYATRERMTVNPDGELQYDDTDDELAILIQSLQLNSTPRKSMRAQKFEDFNVLSLRRGESDYDERAFRRQFGYPSDLPDLAAVKPQPKANAKPAGLAQSFYEQRNSGTLPDSYC